MLIKVLFKSTEYVKMLNKILHHLIKLSMKQAKKRKL